MKKTDAPLVFPVVDFPDPPGLSAKEYDRFLKETILTGDSAAACRYDPVPAVFRLVKEDVPSKDKS